MKALLFDLIYDLVMMDVENNCKILHTAKSDLIGFEASLLLEESNRQHVLQVNISDQIHEDETITYLVELFNYYQCLITPPIIAAPQVEFVDQFSDLKVKRSAPGMGKINGRTRLKIDTQGRAEKVGQLFRQLYRNETYGLNQYSANDELVALVKKLFKR